MSSLATILSFCSHDVRFLSRAIEEAHHFSDQIILSYCDHFFDGTPENRPLLDLLPSLFPDVQCVEFAYDVKRLYIPYLSCTQDDPNWPRYWAATTRYVGYHALKPSIDTVLFLDTDEIPDGRRFRDWLSTYNGESALSFASYFYDLLPHRRARGVQEIFALFRRDALQAEQLLHRNERHHLFTATTGLHKTWVVGLDGLPLLHHYSWTRTRPECLAKARRWGHRADGPWEALIDEWFREQSRLHTGFGQALEYEEVEPFFDPFATPNRVHHDRQSLFLASMG